MQTITRDEALEMIKNINAETDQNNIRFRTMFLISIGFCAGEAYAEALQLSGVR